MIRNDPRAQSAVPVDAAGSQRPTHVRYLVLAAGFSLAMLIYIQRQAFVRAMPEIQRDLGLNTEQMGYLASVFLLAYGVFQIPSGSLGDRVGARHLLTILVLGWSLITGVTALAGSPRMPPQWQFAFLIGMRLLLGVFQSGGFPVFARVIADWIPVAQRGSAQGAVWMFSRLGGAVSGFVFLWLFNLFGTWTTPLWVVSALGIVWCALYWPWFRDEPRQMPQVNAAERALIAAGRDPSADAPSRLPWSVMLGSLNVWALCAVYGFVGFSGNFVTSLLPSYLATNRGLSPEATTWVSGLPLAFGIVSCALGGYLSDWISRRWDNRKWGRRLNASIGLVFAGLTILAVPWVESVWLLALLISGSFFFNDLNIGPAWAACADVGERHAGTISGAMNMAGQFGGATGMALAGRLLHQGRPELLFAIFACSYGLAACCWMAVDVTRPLRQAADG